MLIEKYKSGKILDINHIKIKSLFSENYLFLLIILINILMICTFMSTKVLRFILPILPFLAIITGLYLSRLSRYKWIQFYKFILIIIFLITTISIKFDFKNLTLLGNNYLSYQLIHKEIINEIDKYSPNLTSVIAVIPDTKELNTFNLAAESNFQNKKIYFRQIISNDESYQDDLKRFNWFLVKDGSQGIMTNKSKVKLSDLVKKSDAFENFKSWKLPDGSKLSLLKRKIINESISLITGSSDPKILILNFQENGLVIKFKGNSEIINDSNLLINAKNNEERYEINISLPKIFNLKNKNIELIKNINLSTSFLQENSLYFGALILNKDNNPHPITINKIIYEKSLHHDSKNKLAFNKIEEVEKMGKFLKNGEFDNLFNLVGLVNQSDPEQEYLKDAEKIFKYRYELDKSNINNLYNIAISQILQKKSSEASKTLLEIQKVDPKNSNLYLAKSIVDIYNFKPRQAEKNILIAKKLNKNKSLKDSIQTINIISNLINLRIKSFIEL